VSPFAAVPESGTLAAIRSGYKGVP
jgi:hypothetical protein